MERITLTKKQLKELKPLHGGRFEQYPKLIDVLHEARSRGLYDSEFIKLYFNESVLREVNSFIGLLSTRDNGSMRRMLVNQYLTHIYYDAGIHEQLVNANTEIEMFTSFEVESIKAIDASDTHISRILSQIRECSDGSVHGDAREYMLRSKAKYTEMRQVLDVLLRHVVVDTSCGLHFHFSIAPRILSQNNAKKVDKYIDKLTNDLYRLAIIYEKRIFDLVPDSRKHNSFCQRIVSMLSDKSKNTVRGKLGRLSPSKYSNNKRYSWINFVELYRNGGIGTIEFRLLGNTRRYEYIMAMYRLFVTLIYCAMQFDAKSIDSLYEVNEIIEDCIEHVKRVQFRNVSACLSSTEMEEFNDVSHRRINEIIAKIENITV